MTLRRDIICYSHFNIISLSTFFTHELRINGQCYLLSRWQSVLEVFDFKLSPFPKFFILFNFHIYIVKFYISDQRCLKEQSWLYNFCRVLKYSSGPYFDRIFKSWTEINRLFWYQASQVINIFSYIDLHLSGSWQPILTFSSHVERYIVIVQMSCIPSSKKDFNDLGFGVKVDTGLRHCCTRDCGGKWVCHEALRILLGLKPRFV